MNLTTTTHRSDHSQHRWRSRALNLGCPVCGMRSEQDREVPRRLHAS
jgi:hypothetical protein